MKSRTVLSVFAVFVALFSCSMIGYILGSGSTPKGNPPEQISQSSQKKLTAKADTITTNTSSDTAVAKGKTVTNNSGARYILREADGKVALFTRNADGTEKLHSSYDVPIIFLPENDRKLLKKGIEFDSLDEIIKFAEDYVG